MGSVTISESGMLFGRYKENQVFQIEKCSQYCESLRQHGIKCCEFILLREKTLYFIEAKSSCPKHLEAGTSEEKRKKYEDYVTDISMKMKHSLMLYANILLNRYEQKDVPPELLGQNLSDKKIRLVLVVKTGEKQWLIPFQDVLGKRLRDEMRIWKIQTVCVITEETARKKHFIV